MEPIEAPRFRETPGFREDDPRYPVTFRLTVRHFRRLMPVFLDADAPDDLTDRILTDASPPRAGLIRFRVTPDQAGVLLALTRLWCQDDAELRAGMGEVLAALEGQLGG